MRSPLVSRLLLLIVITWTFAVPSLAESQSEEIAPPRYVGWIEEIRAPAYLRSTGVGATLLDPKRDRLRRLRDGESVRCGSGGRLKLQIQGKPKEIKESPDWFPIHEVLSANPDIVRAIESYGRIGGRDRAVPSEIFSPSPGGAVRVESLVFQWVPNPSLRTVSLIIRDGAGRDIWQQSGVDGTSGQFTSESARETLTKYREKVEQLSLTMVTAAKNEARVYFSLLSAGEEKALDHELEAWTRKESGFLRYVGRAYTFSRYRLYIEAAGEYEAALMLAPESEDLILAMINIYRSIGNVGRINELKRLLGLPDGMK